MGNNERIYYKLNMKTEEEIKSKIESLESIPDYSFRIHQDDLTMCSETCGRDHFYIEGNAHHLAGALRWAIGQLN